MLALHNGYRAAHQNTNPLSYDTGLEVSAGLLQHCDLKLHSLVDPDLCTTLSRRRLAAGRNTLPLTVPGTTLDLEKTWHPVRFLVQTRDDPHSHSVLDCQNESFDQKHSLFTRRIHFME